MANLCGNNEVEVKLHAAGGLELLTALSESDSAEVLTQVGRGFANYSRCGRGRRRMALDGALPRVVALATQDFPGGGSGVQRSRSDTWVVSHCWWCRSHRPSHAGVCNCTFADEG